MFHVGIRTTLATRVKQTDNLLLIFIIYVSFVLINYSMHIKYNWIKINDTTIMLYLLSSSKYTIFVGIFIIFLLSKTIINVPYIFSFFFLFFVTFYFINYRSTYLYVNLFLRTISQNITLQNGLVNIHPLFVYVAYCALFLIMIGLYFCMYIYKCVVVHMSTLYRYLLISIFGALLGAWWAAQELTWGGFWSWDPVEIIFLLIIFLYIWLYHNINLFFLKLPSVFTLVSCLIIIYVILRTSVVVTVHSFIRSSTAPFYGYYVGWTIMFLMIFFFCKEFNVRKHTLFIYTNQQHIIADRYKQPVITYILFLIVYIYLIFILINSKLGFTFINLSLLICFSIYLALLRVVFEQMIFSTTNLIKLAGALILVYLFIKINTNLGFLVLICILYFCVIPNPVVIHLVGLLTYLIYKIFLISIPSYLGVNIFELKQIYLSISCSCSAPNLLYETSSYIEKKIGILNIKKTLVYAPTFSVYTNIATSNLLFANNTNWFNIFCNEYIWSVFTIETLFILAIAYNYSYIIKLIKLY